MGAGTKSGEAGDRRGSGQGSVDSTLLEELRQPLAAAANYLGAARLLIAPLENESCQRALLHLAQAEKQLLRTGGIIGRMRSASKLTNDSRLS